MDIAKKQAPALCFVIGPIGKEGTAERKHADLLLYSLIKHVLENEEFNYKVKRADEDADPGMIGDRVVTDIIQAPLVVADLTDLNPNAFYELGIRHSTELPTIHVAKAGTLLPFDNVAHRTIFIDLTDWHSIEQARVRLAESVRAILAPSYKVSNPITQANASFKMRQSEDPRDRVLAEMQERMAAFESSIIEPREKRSRFSRQYYPSPAQLERIQETAADLLQQKIPTKEINGRLTDIARDEMNLDVDTVAIDLNANSVMFEAGTAGVGFRLRPRDHS